MMSRSTRPSIFSLYLLRLLQIFISRGGRLSYFSNVSSSTFGSNIFFGTSESAVKCQIWIAISGYVLIAIIKKKRKLKKLKIELYTILQVVSLTLCEKILSD
jgi:hypothetical protein